jgi:hypothetical protein
VTAIAARSPFHNPLLYTALFLNPSHPHPPLKPAEQGSTHLASLSLTPRTPVPAMWTARACPIFCLFESSAKLQHYIIRGLENQPRTVLIACIIFVCIIFSLVVFLQFLLLPSSQNKPNVPSSSPHHRNHPGYVAGGGEGRDLDFAALLFASFITLLSSTPILYTNNSATHKG